MADPSAEHREPWYPTAAYLYVLHLDGPALAWEHLRRRRQPDATPQYWGLRLLEDPGRSCGLRPSATL